MRLRVSVVTAAICILHASSAFPAPDSEHQAALLHLLRQDCGSCHGMTMKGGLGPALLPQNLAGKPDLMLIETILHGRPGTAMPPWKTMLTREDADWLVTRLREGVDDAH